MRKHKLKQIQSIIEITSSRVNFHSQNYNFIKWDVFTCLILYQRHLVLSLSLSLIYDQQPQYVSLVSSSFFFILIILNLTVFKTHFFPELINKYTSLDGCVSYYFSNSKLKSAYKNKIVRGICN